MRFDEIKNHLKKYTVGIAGCGGLGSNCAQMLVRTGITKLVLADFDTISESNLNRQFFFFDQLGQKKAYALKENLLRINPWLDIQAHDILLHSENLPTYFSSCDVIVEAFDQKEHKLMLIETVESLFPDKFVVSVSGLAGLKNVNNMQIVRNGNLVMIGDFEEEVSENNPPLAPKVMIAAALQATEVIQYLLNRS